MISGDGTSQATFSMDGQAKSKFSLNSFGAHFVEITWQPEIARLHVSRVVTVMDAGRIINTLAGRNQIEGGVVMGIGMALMEHTSYDPQNGAPINASLADYIVPVNADVPPIEVHFLDYPDKEINPLVRPRHRRNRPCRHRRRDHRCRPSRNWRPRSRTAGAN